ncbi:O-antigen ligase family protein [Rouxiella sp. T17]|uniref:O-antigen ligase family protein n=1 Tax=Rouxiella sp. T17 TaxID=3085684 RepID=UPI002FCA420D
MITESRKNVFAYNLSFLALIFAVSTDLFLRGYPGKLFYLASYVAIFYTVVYFYQNRRSLKLDKPALCFFITLLLVGISRLVWSAYFKQTHYDDIRSNYALGGKRFVIAAFLLFYFYQFRTLLLRNILKLGVGILFVGLIISVWYGHITPEPLTHRAQWTSDAATTGAYLVVVYSMLTIIVVRACFKDSGVSILLFSLVFMLTMVMLLMTATRSAILLTPIMYVVFFIYYYRSVSVKVQLVLALIIILGAASVGYFTWNRLSEIGSEIAEYGTHNDTSIGARFSMWGAGAHSITSNLIGQSVDSRYESAVNYIDHSERANPVAKFNVAYHLHNDLMDTFSLQGIFGFISLALFFVMGFYFSLYKSALQNYGTLFILLPLFILGLADTVLIQSNTVLMVIMALALSFPVMNKPRA